MARPLVSTSTSRVSEAPATRVPIEQVSWPELALAQLVPEAAMPARSKVRGAPAPVTLTLAVSPVTEANEVLAMVTPHPPALPALPASPVTEADPPSVPPLTVFWSGGEEEGTW